MQNMVNGTTQPVGKSFVSTVVCSENLMGRGQRSKILVKSCAVTVRETKVEGGSSGCWDAILQAACGQGYGVHGGHTTETQHCGSILVVFQYFFLG